MRRCFSVTFDGRDAESALVPGSLDLDNPLAGTHTGFIADQPDGSFFCRITSFEPEKITLHAGRVQRPTLHGTLFGTSTTGVRHIAVKGEIIAKDAAGYDAGIRALRAIWHREPTPSFSKRGIYKLAWEADTAAGAEKRFVFAQMVDELVVWQPHPDTPLCAAFSVDLESADGLIYSGDPVELETMTEGFVSGLDLGVGGQAVGTTSLDDLWNPHTIEYRGAVATPLNIILRVDPTWRDTKTLPPHPAGRYASVAPVVNPTIVHQESGTAYRLEVTMRHGDNIEIDGTTGIASLNGGIQILPTVGSIVPVLSPGTNTLVFADDTPFLAHGSALVVDASYQNIII